MLDFGAESFAQKPSHSPARRPVKHRIDKLPPIIEQSPLLSSIQCHSVISSPIPHSNIGFEDQAMSSQPDLSNLDWVPQQPALPKRNCIKKRIVVPKPKCKVESALDISKTKKYISYLRKEEKKYEERNIIFDENGNPKDIDSIWTSPLSFSPSII